jgi:hypothetical protein
MKGGSVHRTTPTIPVHVPGRAGVEHRSDKRTLGLPASVSFLILD